MSSNFPIEITSTLFIICMHTRSSVFVSCWNIYITSNYYNPYPTLYLMSSGTVYLLLIVRHSYGKGSFTLIFDLYWFPFCKICTAVLCPMESNSSMSIRSEFDGLMDLQICRFTDWQTDLQIFRVIDYWQTDLQSYRLQIGRLADWYIGRLADWQIGRLADGQIDRLIMINH